jgi:hypothetical protein
MPVGYNSQLVRIGHRLRGACPAARSVSPFQGGEEFSRGDAKAEGQPSDNIEAGATSSALYLADVGPMQASALRKLFLGQFGPVAQLANTTAKGGAEVLHAPDAGENCEPAT